MIFFNSIGLENLTYNKLIRYYTLQVVSIKHSTTWWLLPLIS